MITIKKDRLNEYFEAGKEMREFINAHTEDNIDWLNCKDEYNKLYDNFNKRIREDLGIWKLRYSETIMHIIDLQCKYCDEITKDDAINAIKALHIEIEE